VVPGVGDRRPHLQRLTSVAADPGWFASFPVRTTRVTKVRDRPDDRSIAAAVPPAAPVEKGEVRKAGDDFTTQVG
jgi:hypothetical protein